MLLSRKFGESLIIEDNIVITVLGIQGNQISFGINAPKDVSVHREEIYNQIKQEQQDSARDSITEEEGE